MFSRLRNRSAIPAPPSGSPSLFTKVSPRVQVDGSTGPLVPVECGGPQASFLSCSWSLAAPAGGQRLCGMTPAPALGPLGLLSLTRGCVSEVLTTYRHVRSSSLMPKPGAPRPFNPHGSPRAQRPRSVCRRPVRFALLWLVSSASVALRSSPCFLLRGTEFRRSEHLLKIPYFINAASSVAQVPFRGAFLLT